MSDQSLCGVGPCVGQSFCSSRNKILVSVQQPSRVGLDVGRHTQTHMHKNTSHTAQLSIFSLRPGLDLEVGF